MIEEPSETVRIATLKMLRMCSIQSVESTLATLSALARVIESNPGHEPLILNCASSIAKTNTQLHSEQCLWSDLTAYMLALILDCHCIFQYAQMLLLNNLLVQCCHRPLT
jgi:hypothetical protein